MAEMNGDSPARVAALVAKQARRAVSAGRPLFLLVMHEHEGEKLEFLKWLSQGLREQGLHTRTLDPDQWPDRGLGTFYLKLAGGGEEAVNVVPALPRTFDRSRLDPDFLHYLNLHRDRIAREHLRIVLLMHSADADRFMRSAGDLWDFRHHTWWLERTSGDRGEGLWQSLEGTAKTLPLRDEDRAAIDTQIERVRALVNETPGAVDRAALLFDLARWLFRRNAARPAVDVAMEGLDLLDEGPSALRGELEDTLGRALLELGHLTEALAHLQQSLAIWRVIGDRRSEGRALNNISQIYRVWGRYGEVLTHLQQSLEIIRELGERSIEAILLNNISGVYDAWGRYDEALPLLEQSLTIDREIGDRSGEATTLNNLSLIYQSRGRYEEALTLLQQSLTIQRDLGDRSSEATILNNISSIYQGWGRNEEALTLLQQSLYIRLEIGDRKGEANSLNNISQIYQGWGRYDEALTLLQQCLAIQREIGDRPGEAVTCWNLEHEFERRGELARALELRRSAVEIERETRHPDLEADEAHLQGLERRLTKRRTPRKRATR